MPKAYVIAHVTLTNAEQFASEYGSKVKATVDAFGGQFLVRGGEVSYREGEPIGDIEVVIEFPDRAAELHGKKVSNTNPSCRVVQITLSAR